MSFLSKDSLLWYGFGGVLISIFLAMAAFAKRPIALADAAIHEITPKSYVQRTYSSQYGIQSTFIYTLIGLNEKKQDMYFNFTYEPATAALFQKLKGDQILKLWVEKNAFEKVIQMQQGEHVLMNYESTIKSQRDESKRWFVYSALCFAFALLSICIAKFAKPLSIEANKIEPRNLY
jgi:hypothetical protein